MSAEFQMVIETTLMRLKPISDDKLIVSGGTIEESITLVKKCHRKLDQNCKNKIIKVLSCRGRNWMPLLQNYQKPNKISWNQDKRNPEHKTAHSLEKFNIFSRLGPSPQ